MDRYNKITNNEIFVQKMEELTRLEADRIFCRHGMDHLVDVARIAYIKSLEECKGLLTKDIIYGAAFLHDIGRVDEYTTGVSHDEASSKLGAVILPQCGYNSKETALICCAIKGHRGFENEGNQQVSGNIGVKELDYLSEIIHYGDKHSRRCMDCEAKDLCKWPEDKKNRGIV